LNRADPRHARFEARQIVDTVLDLVGPEASQNRVRVTVAVSLGVPAVFVDPIQIEQVLLNLVRNSIEAMVRAGTEGRGLVVSAALSSDEPGFVEFGVRDTGPGFAPEIAERLFTPFTTTKDTGMGLGLSIGRSLVEAHGGRIFVVPSAGGAEIRFTVPVYNQMAADA
jgi:two-component system, LuxR family, sensor kinase FixL